MSLTPAERRLRSQIGAHESWARTENRSARTLPARLALEAKWELLIAGNETTTNLLGGMIDTYAQFPDQYEMIRANPELIPHAIEEHLRYSSPIQHMYRYTRAPYQVGDVPIPTGSRLLISFGAANRDPLAFDEPNTFRADRNPRTHVAFGYGPHLCLGAPLARMEAQAVLRELVNRVSRISTTGPTTWSTNSTLRGPTRLPVVLHKASA